MRYAVSVIPARDTASTRAVRGRFRDGPACRNCAVPIPFQLVGELPERLYCVTEPLTEARTTTSNGRQVPASFRARLLHPALDYIVDLVVAVEGGVAVCIGLSSARRDLDRQDREWVTDVAANLPPFGLRGWTQYAVGIAAMQEASGTGPIDWPDLPESLTSADEAAREHWSVIADVYATQATRRRTATNRARLLNVTSIYRAAVDDGRPPTQAVADSLNVSRSQAAKLVRKARDAKLLGEAMGTRAGERA